MKVTVDKFGRILIPKKLREAGGIEAGSVFEIEMDDSTHSLFFKLVPEVLPHVEYTPWGWPVIVYPDPSVVNFNLKEFINTGYEERGLQLLGLND
ncbi:hypothetical protein QWY85_17485 [Neolewinella lacunae]|uniref:SpoVT-AbrB domain-containing protein n=1 Tax=Neolewinella lacunae TaxID=1517758 RepID=A0A923T9S4_9BACT|nr:AbrB/MazE/SpoVT family DNA-binding domain-containing protein [Neolewinella lacunae]MBC6995844.1 hypothetical protein [Neolewinella lacunae]MDN3636463.1 hypothetical protein [Neolewinella lacunae]